MAVPLTDLRTTFYDILREEQDTSAYPLTFVDLLLNSAQQKICHGRVVNPLTKEEARKGQLPFLNTDYFYANVKLTTLTADTTIGATELSANTDGFPTAGVLYIEGDIIEYTGVTGTEFTGVTGVLFAHLGGTEVSIVFTLPSDFASMINITYNNRMKLPQKLYDDIFEDMNSYKRKNKVLHNEGITVSYKPDPFYSIKDGKYLIVYGLNSDDKAIRLRYEKQPPTLSASQDAIIDNDIYAQTTIPYLAVGETMFNRGEEQRAGEIINFAMGQIKEMYNFYNNKEFEKISGVQYKTAKSRLNI